MGLETVTHISDLVVTNATSSDPKSQGDDHIRNIKSALKTDFPNISGPVTASQAELNLLDGLSIQPAAKDGSNLTTPALGDSSTKIATTAFVAGTAFSSVLPAQTGNSGKFVTTDGTTASWASVYPAQSGNSGKFLKTDGTNTSWDYAGISTVGATVTDNYTIVSVTPTIWPCATTAIGKAITAPAVDASTPLGLFAVIDNKAGGYPVGFRDSTGTLIAAVAAGGVAQVYLEANGTAAGTWRVTGTNLEPGLITIDNTFSSTYSSTVLKPFVALDDNKSIHFAALSSGFAAFCVDKTTGAVGTPVTVDATASSVPKTVFKVSSTTAIVFYGSTNDTLYGVVISLSGATTLAVGTAANSGANTNIAVEDFSGAPKIAQLASGLYLVSWATATGAGNTSTLAISVSGTTVTFGSKADIITSNNVANSTTTYALTATTALVIYLSGASAPYTINAAVVSVSGTTCTVGAPAAAGGAFFANYGPGGPPASVLLSATKCIFIDDTSNPGTTVNATAITISGTTLSFGTRMSVESGIASTNGMGGYLTNSATRYNPHLWRISDTSAGLWYVDINGVSRAVVLSESGGTVTKGTILYRSISSAASGNGDFGVILPQGTTEFVSLKQNGASSMYPKMRITPHSVSGTTIEAGSASVVTCLDAQNQVDSQNVQRLSSGDYVIGSVNGMGNHGIYVFRSANGVVAPKGVLPAPALVSSSLPNAVASNRVVILGGTGRVGTTVSASTAQLRLLSVEICA